MTTGEIDQGQLERSVRLPLENIAFALEQYMLENGTWLDPETRRLIAGVRDGVLGVAMRSGQLGRGGRPAARRDAAPG